MLYDLYRPIYTHASTYSLSTNLAIKISLVTMAPKTKKPKVTKPVVGHDEVTKEEETINQNFSLQVAMHVIRQHVADNESVVCSPVSIDTILSILATGAENYTLDQLLKLLGYADVGELNEAACKLSDVLKDSDKEDAPEISSVNALWLDRRFSLKAKFRKVLRNVHKAQVSVVDFVNEADKVVDEANSWAEEQTKGLIKQFLTKKNINNDTSLLLANALYFKGIWHKNFEPKDTKQGDFILLNGDKVRVQFMNQRYKYFEYGTSDECQVLQMPYKTGEFSDDDEDSPKCFSMYVFLPLEKNGLPNLLEKMMIDPNSFIDKFKFKSAKIARLSIPRFNFESDINLKEAMKQLGLTLPFEENCRDFSGIIDVSAYPVYVSDIYQKCRIETNEQGTEAVAVTRFGLMCGAAPPSARPPPPINFVADHPFLFMIREEISGAILFVGTMINPK